MTRRPGPGLRIAILDPATFLGSDVAAVLSERAFPADRALFHTASAEEALLSRSAGQAAVVAPADPDCLERCAVAFACGSAEGTRRFLAARHSSDGCLLLDLAGGAPEAPLADGRRATVDGDVIRLPEPTAFLLAELVRLVETLAPVRSLRVVVDRPMSEVGRDALDEMFEQAIALAAFRSVPKEILGAQAAFNLHHPADSAEWEKRVARDLRSLSPSDLDATIFSARAGVFHGHHLRIEASFKGTPPPEAAIRAALFAPATGFENSEGKLLGPVEAAGRDEWLVLRLEVRGDRLFLALAADHLRRGGALLAVRVAEQAISARGLLADA